MAAFTIRAIKADHVSDIIEFQAKVWQDYFLTERHIQVPLLHRTRQNLLYYLEKEPDGCFLAEVDGKAVGAIFSHVWGSVGWFGPLEVVTEYQAQGIGTALVKRSVEYLTSKGCGTIGLETMASSDKNIELYTKLGFKTREISYVYFKTLALSKAADAEVKQPRKLKMETDLGACKTQWERLIPGLDYTSELDSTEAKNLGDIWAIETGTGLGHAILHTYEMFDNSRTAIVKLLVAGKGDEKTASDLLKTCENSAIAADKTGLFVRNYATTPPGFNFFLERGYVLRSTSIRMIYQGQDETGETVHVSCWSG